MPVTNMIAVHVADQDSIDLAKARVLGSRDRAARILEKPGAVRVLKHHGPVKLAEFAVVAAERRDLDLVCLGRTDAYRCRKGSTCD